MNRALFLDRDGVINVDTGYVGKIEDFRFVDGIFQFCKDIQSKGYLIIVVTNQAGIARGYYKEAEFLTLNDWMLEQFMLQGVEVTDVYYCPYHPEYGVGEYKVDSADRKPNPGMILRARDDYCIDLSHSVLVGDKEDDLVAGYKAGVGLIVFLEGRYSCSPLEFPYDTCCNFQDIVIRVNERDQVLGGR